MLPSPAVLFSAGGCFLDWRLRVLASSDPENSVAGSTTATATALQESASQGSTRAIRGSKFA